MYHMQAGEPRSNEPAQRKILCQICGLAFASEAEKEKHWELEHMKNKKPAGVRQVEGMVPDSPYGSGGKNHVVNLLLA